MRTLKPNYVSYEDHNAVIEAFHAGHWFREPSNDNAYVTINDIEAGESVRIEYFKIIEDFNFGDNHLINRTFSVIIPVRKTIH